MMCIAEVESDGEGDSLRDFVDEPQDDRSQ